MMKRSILWSMAAIAGSLLLGSFGSPASAESGTLVIGTDPNFGGVAGGGEFHVTAFTGMTLPQMASNAAVAGHQFHTFCLEKDADLAGSPPKFNWTLGVSAHNGGIGGALAGDASDPLVHDPICAETAYLYSQFWNGTLTGPDYDYADIDYDPASVGGERRYQAFHLQQAIWVLENEVVENSSSVDASTAAYLAQARAAVSGGSWTGIGNVRVLTLTTDDGTPKQDVLVMIPAPPPPTDCCGYKDLTFKYKGSDCDSISAIDPGHCGGYFDTSLNPWGSVKCNTTFTVYADSCWKSGKFHDSIKLVVKNKCGTVIECTTIDTDCNPPLVVGTVYGSFTLTGFHEANCKPKSSCGWSSWGSWCWDKKAGRWSRKSNNCDDDDDNKDWCGSNDNRDRGELKGCADWSFLKGCRDFRLPDCSKSFKFCDSSSWSSWFSNCR